MVVQTDFFFCQIKILHLGSFERSYIVSLTGPKLLMSILV